MELVLVKQCLLDSLECHHRARVDMHSPVDIPKLTMADVLKVLKILKFEGWKLNLPL